MKSERVTRAQRRYISSVQDLQNAIPNKLQRLGTITFPDFTVIAGTANKAKALQETLDKVMEVTPELEKIQKSRETKKKVGDVVIGCFRASYPFANLFLTVAKDASGIHILNPYGVLCGGLLALVKITYEEIGRASVIKDKLTFLTSIVSRLELNSDVEIVEDVASAHIDNTECAVLYVFAAIMDYLTLVIRHFSKSLLVNIGKNIISPSNAFQNCVDELNEAIQVYAAAIGDLELKLSIEMFKEGKNLRRTLIELFDQTRCQLSTMGSTLQNITDDQNAIREKVRQEMDDDFLHWLSPSYWQVEGQLEFAKNRRQPDTLDWVSKMPEFQKWIQSEPDSVERVLWIRGSAGIGKSVMAGWIINHLKTAYPCSIVAYFFCKRGEDKLIHCVDILRTIAYQCAKQCAIFQSSLQNLRKERFQISSTVGVNFLMKKLLKEPLTKLSEDVYIVLDGLDEAEGGNVDLADKLRRPEIEVLIEGFVGLAPVRVLFISRPILHVPHQPPLLVKKLIEGDNRGDIEIYVRNSLLKISSNFQRWYPKSAPEPIEFFTKRSKGLFLWVSTVLHQLSIAKTKSKFNTYFNSLSEASGDMDLLYVGVFERIDDDDKVWVFETLKWIIAAERPLDLSLLKELVQWSLNDERDFEEFLEITCGSFLQISPQAGSTLYVQMIHETLISFLFNQQMFPKNYFIESQVHSYITTKCIECLLTESASQSVVEYAAKNWIHGLSKANSVEISMELMRQLFKLFTSDALMKWIQYSLLEIWTPLDGVKINVETHGLKVIMEWLNKVTDVGDIRISDSNDNTEIDDAIQWCQSILKQQSLGDSIGKAAAKIWLFGELTDSWHIANAFRLALKYYVLQEKTPLNEAETFRCRSAILFRDMDVWSGRDRQYAVNSANLAIAFSVLGMWTQCIEAFQKQANIDGHRFRFWKELGHAYKNRGDYDGAIDAFQKAVDKCPTDHHLWNRLGDAYRAKGDYDAAIDIFQKAVHKFPTSLLSLNGLSNVYKAKGDYDRAIEIFQKAMDRHPIDPWLWNQLGDAYITKGDYDGAINTFQKAVDEFPTDYQLWNRLSDAYKTKGDYDGVIKTFQKAVDMLPTHSWSWINLGEAYSAKADYDGAINTFQEAVHKWPTDSWLLNRLGDAYKAKGDYDGAINTFQTAADKFPTFPWPWNGLGDAYKAKGDYDGAINTFQKAVDRCPLDLLLWNRLIDAYKAKGDYDSAINAFQTAVVMYPRDPWTWTRLGDIYKTKGDYEAAIDTFKDATEKFPMQSWLWDRLGAAFKAKGDYDGAIVTFKDATERFPMQSWWWDRLSDAFKAKGDYDGAIDTIWKAVNIFPASSRLWNRLGHTHKAKGDYDGAIDTFWKAVSTFSKDSRWWYQLGDAYKAKGDYDGAIDMFWKAIDTFPTDLRLWYGLGDAYKAKDDYDGAIDMFWKAIDTLPTDLWLWGWLSDAYKAKGDFNGAIDTFRKAMDTFPTHSWLWNRLGNTYKAKGDYRAAIDTFKEAIEKFSTDYMSLFFLGNIYETIDTNTSLAMYEQALEKSKTNSFLSALIRVHLQHFVNGESIEINSCLVNSVFGLSIAESYKKSGGLARGIEIYNMTIQTYKNALDMPYNTLLWTYVGTSDLREDIFRKRSLPKIVLWSALGEVYRIKAETEKLLGNRDQETEDIEKARSAFQNALELDQENVWLNYVVRELAAS